ncbi:MAG: sigma-54 interaction domain-containing protein [Ignavibacteriaceae bacterium]
MTIESFQQKFGIIGKSKEIKDLVDITMQVAQSDISVLIYGESGTGKEIFARALHGFSKRAAAPLISVNCGAIPEGILESELFGHKKGSFTGASETRKGYFELADTGTLFLDEIAEMPITTQVKLLRAIETREFLKVGGESVTQVDVRFIAATNKDLQIEVESKRFREDLYFRLKAVTLYVPPLRKRKEDVPELVRHFMKNFADQNNVPPLSLGDDAYELLINYSWPGNIRELKNTVETAAALSKTGFLSAENFNNLIRPDEYLSSSRNTPVLLRKTPEDADREFIYRALFELKKDILELKDIVVSKLQEFEASGIIRPADFSASSAEKEAILRAMQKAKWNKNKAAELLGMNLRTLYRKLEDYDI